MTLETWLLFVVAEGALSFTPGPAVLLVLSQGLTRGTSASVFTSASSPRRQHVLLRAVRFTALLPPFIDPHGSVLAQVAILGVTSVVIEFFVLLAYGALAGRLTSVATRPRVQTVANRVAGVMLVGAGVSVALQKNT